MRLTQRLLVLTALLAGCGGDDTAAGGTDSPGDGTEPVADGSESGGESGTDSESGVVQEDCVVFGDGQTGITQTARFDPFFQAVVDIQAYGDARASAVYAALETLAAAWDLPALGAQPTATEVESLVTALADSIPDATLSALAIDVTPPECGISTAVVFEVGAACMEEAECDAPAVGDPLPCQGVCRGDCQGTYTGVVCDASSQQCDGSCEGTCTSDVAMACQGVCEGTCDLGNTIEEDFEGYCAGACTGACTTSAGGSCSGACDGSCVAQTASTDWCDGSVSCRGVCEGECGGLCEGTLAFPECQGLDLCGMTASAAAAAATSCSPADVRIAYPSHGEDADLDTRMDVLATTVGELLQIRRELQLLAGSDDFGAPPSPILHAISRYSELLVQAGASATTFEVIAPERRHCVIPALIATSPVVLSTFQQVQAAEEPATAFLSTLFDITE